MSEDLSASYLNNATDMELSGKAKILIGVFEVLKEHPYGYVAFLVFLTVWTILALPVTPIEVCAGYVFGPIWGPMGSLLAKTLGCLGALSIGRTVGKSQGWAVPEALDKYLSLLKTRPLRAMCMIRIAPVPLGVKNYGLSLVSFPDDNYPFAKYFWACVLVNTPLSIMWGLTGYGASSLFEIVSKYA